MSVEQQRILDAERMRSQIQMLQQQQQYQQMAMFGRPFSRAQGMFGGIQAPIPTSSASHGVPELIRPVFHHQAMPYPNMMPVSNGVPFEATGIPANIIRQQDFSGDPPSSSTSQGALPQQHGGTHNNTMNFSRRDFKKQ
jgi:hypothetical protein